MSQVSARVLDEAIAWQLCQDSGETSEQQRQNPYRQYSHVTFPVFWHRALALALQAERRMANRPWPR